MRPDELKTVARSFIAGQTEMGYKFIDFSIPGFGGKITVNEFDALFTGDENHLAELHRESDIEEWLAGLALVHNIPADETECAAVGLAIEVELLRGKAS